MREIVRNAGKSADDRRAGDGDIPPVYGRMSAGVEFSCALDNKNKAYCFGNNFSGQIGVGDFKKYDTPQLVKGGHTWKMIGAGDWHTCGLTTAGDAYCWGYNTDGRCGSGNFRHPITTPNKVVGGYKYKWISTGYWYTCAIRNDGAMYCWGKEKYGRMGQISAEKNYTSPVRVGKDNDWAEVYAGGDHTCAMKTDRTVWCFGNNEKGSLGVGKTYRELKTSAKPLKVAGKYRSLSSNSRYACGVTITGKGVCWGSNLWKMLGTGSAADANKPTPVAGGGTWLQISAGQFVTTGIKSGNVGYYWGKNYATPQKFKGPSGPYITLSSGDWNALGVVANGTGYAWAENEHGEGGVGYIGYLQKPTRIVGGAIWGPPKN
ncbi:putative Ultraviolet-B receptor UVR8 [Nannochloris sp. 'desiccata']|nr:putative Ultraviolet-B receptor UVR8 [Chlorella desiccata (nom. nud.)]